VRLAPLYILRHLKAYPYHEDGMSIEEINHMNGAATTDVELLLLDYNASTVSMENREYGNYKSGARVVSHPLS
jgi:hypothetical protein